MGSAWNSRFAWTDEHKELALKMWNDGHSYTEIAARIGCHSRSAVGAKLARLGAPKRDGSERKWDSLTERERARARTAAKAAARPPRPPRQQRTGRWSLTERTWIVPSIVKLRCLEGVDVAEPDLPDLRTIKRPMRPYEAAARDFLRHTGWHRVGNRYVRREPSPVFAGKEWAA